MRGDDDVGTQNGGTRADAQPILALGAPILLRPLFGPQSWETDFWTPNPMLLAYRARIPFLLPHLTESRPLP